jgi:hypothetical protein
MAPTRKPQQLSRTLARFLAQLDQQAAHGRAGRVRLRVTRPAAVGETLAAMRFLASQPFVCGLPRYA